MFHFKKRRVRVLDTYISYVDTRAGEDVVIFLHGNPLSAYVWRNIIPHVQGVARCFAPDLLGMGDSGKEPRHSYTFQDHYRYFTCWMEALKLSGKFIFVCQELGSMLAFHWCSQNEAKVKAIIHMEAIVAPFNSYDDIGPKLANEIYWKMRNEGAFGERVLQGNSYLEVCLAGMKLKDSDASVYRLPYQFAGNARRPMLTGIKELPIAGEGPNDVIEIVQAYRDWLAKSQDVPKLFIKADPGLFSTFNSQVVADWPHQETVTVNGRHFPQEESPEMVGGAISRFIKELQWENIALK